MRAVVFFVHVTDCFLLQSRGIKKPSSVVGVIRQFSEPGNILGAEAVRAGVYGRVVLSGSRLHEHRRRHALNPMAAHVPQGCKHIPSGEHLAHQRIMPVCSTLRVDRHLPHTRVRRRSSVSSETQALSGDCCRGLGTRLRKA